MKSSVVAPKRRAIAASPITSPAFVPSIETPMTRRVGCSSTILITPRVSWMAPARIEVAHSLCHLAQLLHLLLFERIEHGTGTSGSFSCAKRGHLEQGLSHTL